MKIAIVLFALAAIAYAAPASKSEPVHLLRHEESHDEDGHRVEFELDNGSLFKEISKKALGPEGEVFFRRQGVYKYKPHPDAEFIEVHYEADENGFRAKGQHLP